MGARTKLDRAIFLTLLFLLQFIFFVCVVCINMDAGVHIGLALGLELPAFINSLAWLLGTELASPLRVVLALSC